MSKTAYTVEDLDELERLEELGGKMRASVREAVESADHLEDEDAAAIELAYQLADIIDGAWHSGDEEKIHKASFGPMPSLHKVLTSLGLNPEGRQKLGLLREEDEDEDW